MSYKLDVVRKTMEVSIYGEKHKLRFPTCEEMEGLETKLAALKSGSDMMQAMREYLEKLGLPSDVSKTIDTIDFSDVIAFVNNPKKSNG